MEIARVRQRKIYKRPGPAPRAHLDGSLLKAKDLARLVPSVFECRNGSLDHWGWATAEDKCVVAGFGHCRGEHWRINETREVRPVSWGAVERQVKLDVASRVGALKLIATKNVGLRPVAKKEGQGRGVLVAVLTLICNCIDELKHGCETGATREEATTSGNEAAD